MTGTSDGITPEDWQVVTQLALNLTNAIMAGGEEADTSAETQELLDWLDELQHRYGALPSLLATRADYLNDAPARLALLQEAYDLALQRRDGRNLVMIASSMLESFTHETPDLEAARLWQGRLASALADHPDPDEERVLRECSQLIG